MGVDALLYHPRLFTTQAALLVVAQRLLLDPCDLCSPLRSPAALLQALAAQAGISAMPTFQVWVNGAKADELVGANLDRLKAMIEKAVAAA